MDLELERVELTDATNEVKQWQGAFYAPFNRGAMNNGLSSWIVRTAHPTTTQTDARDRWVFFHAFVSGRGLAGVVRAYCWKMLIFNHGHSKHSS